MGKHKLAEQTQKGKSGCLDRERGDGGAVNANRDPRAKIMSVPLTPSAILGELDSVVFGTGPTLAMKLRMSIPGTVVFAIVAICVGRTT